MPDVGKLPPILRSRTLLNVAVYAALAGAYSVIPAAKEATEFALYGDLPAEIHAALTLVLGWLLVFRTNAAYARWWEARTLWGQLVNVSRNVAVKINSLGTINATDRMLARRLLVDFAPLLRDHLRRELRRPESDRMRPDTLDLDHAPSDIIQELYALFNRWKLRDQIDGNELLVIDSDAREFLNVCGACERIRNTQIVRSYRIFARQCVILFLLTFPWGIADEFHWWTVPLTVITAYFMLGMETVAEHVEEPFGYDEDDLDLDGLCETIAKSVNQIFDQSGKFDQYTFNQTPT